MGMSELVAGMRLVPFGISCNPAQDSVISGLDQLTPFSGTLDMSLLGGGLHA